MGKNPNKNSKLKSNIVLKKCGAVSCINNIQGLCDFAKCELYERSLAQEY
ncbi:MAG: hypothetical protein KZY61_13500 [Clostridiaceae bacterium]|nr:hypothetical protein [Clostridiaceae bacterium]MBW4859925.1 hypothetical protein [Clostridiaceae bacterium]MBW4869645.1 hypothetical protein [Clostridiaceae bacterium]